MFKIINTKNGTEIGSTENPRYIKKKDTGCYIQTDRQNAQGIAYKGAAYNLQGRDGIDANLTSLFDKGVDEIYLFFSLF